MNLPKELTALPQWVCWRLEKDTKHKRDAKVPYSPTTGKRASTSNPSTWSTFDQAVSAKEKYLFPGIGFVFTAECGIIGIDIDNCIIDGKPNEVAAAILRKIPTTYVELSPSGKGLHIFLRGSAPAGGNRNSENGVEMYSKSRYFTMTGSRWTNCSDEIALDNGVIKWIFDTFIKQKTTAKMKKATENKELLREAVPSAEGLYVICCDIGGRGDNDFVTKTFRGNYLSCLKACMEITGVYDEYGAENGDESYTIYHKGRPKQIENFLFQNSEEYIITIHDVNKDKQIFSTMW